MPRTLAAALLCLGLALPAFAPAFAQDAPPADGPVATAPEAMRPNAPRASSTAPTDDYGYVAWCYGAVSGYVDQYDATMPEVVRIERAFPTPSTEDNIAKVYPGQRDTAKAQMASFAEALAAADKASPRSNSLARAQGLSRGRAIWNGSAMVTKAQLAQFWMGWTPPADCDTRAKTLLSKSALFGQALGFNAQPVPEAPVVAPPEPMAEPAATPASGLAPEPAATLAAADVPAAADAPAAAPEAASGEPPARKIPNIDDLLASPVGGPILRGGAAQ